MGFEITGSIFRPARIAVIVWVALTAIFCGNLFRFNPAQIDGVYDTTSEASVIGRLARVAADGFFRNTDLGSNLDPQYPNAQADADNYKKQVRYFEHPELIHSLGLGWGPYPSHFGLQGFVFAAIDLINPLPRNLRIPFYHLLASLFTAGMLVWMAAILRSKFGWAAFIGFLLPAAIEPMFSALAPNLCWFVGSWLVPIPFGMLLADEDNARRRRILFGLLFLAFLARFLCGYEFTSTIILATAVGCLLTVKERPDVFRHVLRNASSVIGVGITAFIVAAIAQAAKLGGFTVFAQKAAMRMIGDGPSLEYQLVLGKFQPIGAVIWLYLGGNYITLIKSFGLVLAYIALTAILILLDERFNWFYGTRRGKLQVLALAVLASFAAPLSWFVLGKGHSFNHLPFDLMIWYVPTIPLGFAMVGVAIVSFVEHLRLKRGDALKSWLVAAIPVVVVGAALTIRLIDKRIETAGTWAITEHANAHPIFENPSLGIEFRMNTDWFTVLYPCSSRPPDRIFQIEAEQDGSAVNYSFERDRNQVLSRKGTCIAVRAKSDRPISRIHFGETSGIGPIWQRDATISLPDTFKPEALSNEDWVHASGPELLVNDTNFGRLLIKKGDQVLISPTDRRTIISISSAGNGKVLTLDGAPLSEDSTPVFGIIRK
ncbi:MAG: hypothetical protein JWL86_2048 [Rhizobium sp.]|nr:hypothetical protein [Rhizobium sp.]